MTTKKCVAIAVANCYSRPTKLLLFRLPVCVEGVEGISPWQMLIHALPEHEAAPDFVVELASLVFRGNFQKHAFYPLGTAIEAGGMSIYPYLLALPERSLAQCPDFCAEPHEWVSLSAALRRVRRFDYEWQPKLIERLRSVIKKRREKLRVAL